jgi:hypothetical protein
MASIIKQIEYLYGQVKCLKKDIEGCCREWVGERLYLSTILTAPISSIDTGTKGEVRVVGADRYECIATNTWVKSTVITTF